MRKYTLMEEAGWLYRNIVPLAGINRSAMWLPGGRILNEISPSVSIAALGDCMDMRGRTLRFGNRLRQFISSNDFMLVNWEGTLTDKPRFGLRQRHDLSTAEALRSLCPASRIVLSVANNHAADYGFRDFEVSLRLLSESGCHVIGTKVRPSVDLSPSVRIIAASVWTNKPCTYIADLDDALKCIKTGAFNLLYIHWGHEMELHPRTERVKEAQELLTRFDAVIGHHPHLPQPVTEEAGPVRKVAAYSLGNCATGLAWERYRHGLVLSLRIGMTERAEPAAGKVEWRFIRCTPDGRHTVITDILDRSPFFTYQPA